MKVTNINGTSPNVCECGSWIQHWKNFSGQSVPLFCPEKDCRQKPEVGAHVQKDGSNDRGWYIVPLCTKCNGKKGQSITISDNVNFVSANVSETCGQ